MIYIDNKKNRAISYVEPFTKINVTGWKKYCSLFFIAINILVLTVIFISDTILNKHNQLVENISIGDLKKLEQQMVRYLIVYLLSSGIDIIFVIYIFFASNKIKIGYVFVFCWLILWIIFGISPWFIYEDEYIIKILNFIVGLGNAIALFGLVYDLHYKKRLNDIKRSKERYQI